MDGKEAAKVIAKAIFYASIQASIGSVEMSSKFSVKNFSKDQDTLDSAAQALRNYIWIGSAWSVGTILALYANYALFGALAGFVANAVMMGWVIITYINAFDQAAKKYKLKNPKVLTGRDVLILIVAGLVISFGGCYFIRPTSNQKGKSRRLFRKSKRKA